MHNNKDVSYDWVSINDKKKLSRTKRDRLKFSEDRMLCMHGVTDILNVADSSRRKEIKIGQ